MLNAMGPHDDESCNYRKLYEGAQSSLTDMAGKHAASLGRIGRLRNSIVQVCKNTAPAAFAQLESKMSRRLSDSDDQMIVAAVEHLLREAGGSESTDIRTSRELRRMLALRGVILSGDNPGEWIKQLGGQQVETDTEEFLATELSFFSALSRRRERALDEAAATALPVPPPDAWSQAVERLLGKKKTEAQISAEAAAENALQDEAFRQANPELAEQVDAKPARKKPGKSSKPRASDRSEPDTTWPSSAPVSWDKLDKENSTPTPDSTFIDSPPQEPSQSEPTSQDTPATVSLEPERKMAPAQPVRVELFPNPNPTPTRKRTRKTPRTTAIPPESFQDLSPARSLDSLTDLLSSVVRSPRPVFTSELAEIAGSDESFESWKSEQMADGSTVRFIAPKARHKQRGALVIPVGIARDELDAKGPNWWSVILDKWRGAKLYELAVLLSKVTDSVSSYHIDDHLPYVNLTLSRDRGVTGVVVLCDDDISPSGPGFSALREGLSDMLSKQTELTVVLVTADKSLDDAINAAASIYAQEGWSPNSPVVVSRSWEWANDTGTVVEVQL
jgi:hypothetical protein